MSVRRVKSATAMTLVEVMLAMVVLSIAAVGALSYEYHAAGHAKTAETRTN